MCQNKDRSEQTRDSRLGDLISNKTRGPAKPCSEKIMWAVLLALLDKKNREGNVSFTTKKSRGMLSHRNWLLDGSIWIASLLMRKIHDGDNENLTFHHDNAKKSDWHAF